MAARSPIVFLVGLIVCWIGPGVARAAGAEAVARPADAVVTVEAHVPPDARTAASLGGERRGAGVVIDQGGLVLTIGYLIMEADEVRVVDIDGRDVPADVVAYDHETGFGLLRALRPLHAKAARIGSAVTMEPGRPAVAVAPGFVLPTTVVSRRSFAGGWEYLLEDALFTAPPIPNFGGAGLFDDAGRLVGIGSLIVSDAGGEGTGPHGNVFVPVDLLPPILSDLLAFGHSTAPASPWLGLYPEPVNGVLVVAQVSDGGPAAGAGIQPGDMILGIGEQPVTRLETLWRRVRALGPAGVSVPLKILSHGAVRDVTLTSRDRRGWLRLERTY